ncbi:GGDEF domain-containing protein [Pantanalinema rosaneae CENA516]|uniref:GGDEF domain-containing protein n=1 Tax=Pantanalinema rosaneae TaxID=1620701 RepID=UPI003D6E3597
MNDFHKTLYEAVLVAFGKVLAKYNVFAQSAILKDVGKEIIEYLQAHNFDFEEQGNLDDLTRLMTLFVDNGFAETLIIESADQGKNYIWQDLYGMEAYKTLFDVAENPFLSCPLNLCLYYLADKHNKTFLLHRKSFDLEHHITQSQYELVDKAESSEVGFDPLVLENARLYELACQREEQYRHQAITDPLTGISNRRHMLEAGRKAFSRAHHYDRPLSVLIFDIDHFKRINDTYGHSMGDVTLCLLAGLCQQLVRSIDLLGRIGGEEFLIILPDTPLEGAIALAERLRQAVESTVISTDDSSPSQSSFSITISIGISAYDHEVPSLEVLLDQADSALYQAKASGRNRVVVHHLTAD